LGGGPQEDTAAPKGRLTKITDPLRAFEEQEPSEERNPNRVAKLWPLIDLLSLAGILVLRFNLAAGTQHYQAIDHHVVLSSQAFFHLA